MPKTNHLIFRGLNDDKIDPENIIPVSDDNFGIKSIAVGRTQRRRVATGNGVILINDDGSKAHYRFTKENRSLLITDV